LVEDYKLDVFEKYTAGVIAQYFSIVIVNQTLISSAD